MMLFPSVLLALFPPLVELLPLFALFALLALFEPSVTHTPSTQVSPVSHVMLLHGSSPSRHTLTPPLETQISPEPQSLFV